MKKRHLRVLLGTIGCVVVLAAAGCGGNSSTGPAHLTTPVTVIHPTIGPFTGQIDPAYSYMAISAGYQHTCGLDTSGRAYCWGDNTDGDLGDGTMMQSSRPVAVLGGHVFSAISAGFDQTCAVGAQADSGKLFCWGNNAQGQLGVGNNVGHVAYETQPTEVTAVAGATPVTYTAVSAGYQATCGLDARHLISCWGNDYYENLGVGSGQPFVLYSPTPLDNIPDSAMSNPGTYSSVAVSDMPPVPPLQYLPHMCALSLDQQVYCWGYNGSGELSIPIQPVAANNIDPYPTRPALAGTAMGPLPSGTIFMAVGAGGKFTCGIVVPGMMNIGNGVYCWGDDSRGQFGFTGTGGTAPKFVQSSAAFQSISVGYDSTCGMDANKINPNTYCWGNNSYGQLGIGSVNSGYSGNGFPATTVVAGHHFTMVSVGVDYACGIVTDYSYSVSAASGYAQLPFCWGANDMGQLGGGNTNESPAPVLVLKHP